MIPLALSLVLALISFTQVTSAAWGDRVAASGQATAGDGWIASTCSSSASVDGTSAAGGASVTSNGSSRTVTLPANARGLTITDWGVSLCVDIDAISQVTIPSDGSSLTLNMSAGNNPQSTSGILTLSGLASGVWTIAVDGVVQKSITQTSQSDGSAPPFHGGFVSSGKSQYVLSIAKATAPPTGIPASWAQYSFASVTGATVPDISGNGNNLTLATDSSGVPIPTIANDGGRTYLNFNGSYATLPTGILKNATSLTFSADVKISANPYWQRIFDIGSGTAQNMFLTTRGINGNLQFSITKNGNGNESRIETNYTFPVGQWVAVKLTIQPNKDSTLTGTLYADGVQVGVNTSMLFAPSDLGNTVDNYLGKSQYSGDPTLDGSLSNVSFGKYVPGLPSPWARYTFTSSSGNTVPDVSGNNNTMTLEGTGANTPTIASDGDRQYLKLNGGYAVMPVGLMQNATAFTFSADVNISANRQWQRIFDIGSGMNTNMFLTTWGRNGNLQFSIVARGGYSGESLIQTNYTFPVGQWVSIKLVVTPNSDLSYTGILYANGTEVGRNDSMPNAPCDLGATTDNYLGKSQYGSDPNLAGWLSNVIFSGAGN